MESSDEDLLLDLVFPSSPFPMESSSEEESSTLTEIQTINRDESTGGDLLNGDTRNTFGLAPNNMTRPGAEDRQRKDRKHLSHELIAMFSDEKLEKMSIHDFNKQLRQLPTGLVQRYRRRRRILKNRKYALKSRQKGSEKKNNITEQNAALELEIFRAKQELRKVSNERDEYKKKYARLNTMFSAMDGSAMAKSKHLFE